MHGCLFFPRISVLCACFFTLPYLPMRSHKFQFSTIFHSSHLKPFVFLHRYLFCNCNVCYHNSPTLSILMLSAILYPALLGVHKCSSCWTLNLSMYHGKCNMQYRINVLKNYMFISNHNLWHCAFVLYLLLTWNKSGLVPKLKLPSPVVC